MVWTIANGLAESNFDLYAAQTVDLVRSIRRIPEKAHEIRNFFAWAYRVHEYERAHDVFNALSPTAKLNRATLQYARILERCGGRRRLFH